MFTIARFLTLSLAALVLSLAVVKPAAADAEVAEVYARTRTRAQADKIVNHITQGRVPGWMLAYREYSAAQRVWIVYACRTNKSGSHSSGSLKRTDSDFTVLYHRSDCAVVAGG